MKPHLILILAAAIVTIGLAPAAAQFRAGVPDTLTPPPRPDPDAPARARFEAFKHWNTANHPRLLIFWNRDLTDETSTEMVDHKVVVDDGRSHHTKSDNKTENHFGAAELSNEDALDHRVTTTDSGVRRQVQPLHLGMAQMASNVLETAFTDMFLKAGARLIDREAIIRSLGAQARTDRADTQKLEGQALNAGADYLVEVLPDPSAQGGLVFTVKVVDLRTHTVMARFITAAHTPSGPSIFVATEHGFERRAPSSQTPTRLADELAIEVMGKLAAPEGA